MSKNAIATLMMVRKLGAKQYLNDSGCSIDLCSLECRFKEIFSPCPSMQLNWSDLPFAGSFCNHPEEDDMSFLPRSLSLSLNEHHFCLDLPFNAAFNIILPTDSESFCSLC
jgi:hypothetical protein